MSTTTVATKRPWEDGLIWVNTLDLVVLVLTGLLTVPGLAFVHEPWFQAIIAVANIVLRWAQAHAPVSVTQDTKRVRSRRKDGGA